MKVSTEELSDIKIDISELTIRDVKRIADFLNEYLYPNDPRPTDFLWAENIWSYLYPVSSVWNGKCWGLGQSDTFDNVYPKTISGRDVLKEVVCKV